MHLGVIHVGRNISVRLIELFLCHQPGGCHADLPRGSVVHPSGGFAHTAAAVPLEDAGGRNGRLLAVPRRALRRRNVYGGVARVAVQIALYRPGGAVRIGKDVLCLPVRVVDALCHHLGRIGFQRGGAARLCQGQGVVRFDGQGVHPVDLRRRARFSLVALGPLGTGAAGIPLGALDVHACRVVLPAVVGPADDARLGYAGRKGRAGCAAGPLCAGVALVSLGAGVSGIALRPFQRLQLLRREVAVLERVSLVAFVTLRALKRPVVLPSGCLPVDVDVIGLPGAHAVGIARIGVGNRRLEGGKACVVVDHLKARACLSGVALWPLDAHTCGICLSPVVCPADDARGRYRRGEGRAGVALLSLCPGCALLSLVARVSLWPLGAGVALVAGGALGAGLTCRAPWQAKGQLHRPARGCALCHCGLRPGLQGGGRHLHVRDPVRRGAGFCGRCRSLVSISRCHCGAVRRHTGGSRGPAGLCFRRARTVRSSRPGRLRRCRRRLRPVCILPHRRGAALRRLFGRLGLRRGCLRLSRCGLCGAPARLGALLGLLGGGLGRLGVTCRTLGRRLGRAGPCGAPGRLVGIGGAALRIPLGAALRCLGRARRALCGRRLFCGCGCGGLGRCGVRSGSLGRSLGLGLGRLRRRLGIPGRRQRLAHHVPLELGNVHQLLPLLVALIPVLQLLRLRVVLQLYALTLLAFEACQPLLLGALVAVLHRDAVCADVVSPPRMAAAPLVLAVVVARTVGVRRAVVERKPPDVLPEKCVEHLHGVLVLVVLSVCKVDHGRQVRPVYLVVGRLYQQLLVLVRVIAVCDDLLACQQQHLRLHQPLALVDPLRLGRGGECVGLDLIHIADDALQNCHSFPPCALSRCGLDTRPGRFRCVSGKIRLCCANPGFLPSLRSKLPCVSALRASCCHAAPARDARRPSRLPLTRELSAARLTGGESPSPAPGLALRAEAGAKKPSLPPLAAGPFVSRRYAL